jgi:hypothetical protein
MQPNKKGSEFAPLYYFVVSRSATLLGALRSLVVPLVRVCVTSVMSMVVMMFLGSGWCGFRRYLRLGRQNGRHCK